MQKGLSLQSVPSYRLSAYRRFLPEERHITRVEWSDVLIIMLNGELRFTENGSPVVLRRGEYYIQQKGLKQDGPEESSGPYYFYVHFSNGSWTDETPVLPRRGRCDTEALLPLLSELDKAEGDNAPAVIKNGLLCTLLSRLYYAKERTEKELLADSMARALTADLKDPPTLAELSLELHFSENYLIRIFREVTGMTPHAYLNAARLRKARLILISGNITAERVAEECGFADYAHFYRMFRKDTGVSPKVYRKEAISRGGASTASQTE